MKFGSECMTQNYTTILNTRPFLYQETKKIATLLLDDVSTSEIKKAVTEKNLFAIESVDRMERFTSEILKRLEKMDDFLLEKFVTADVQTSKGILLYAILKKDDLFYEWMREVIREKFLIIDLKLTTKESEHFLERKSEQSKKVREWSDGTRGRLINAYHRVSVEAGLLSKEGHEFHLHHLFIDHLVLEYMRNHKEKHIIETLLGE